MTRTIDAPPAEQYAQGVAAGLTEQEMLRNVDMRVTRLADRFADAIRATNRSDWQLRQIAEIAREGEALRDVRSYIVSRILGTEADA